MKVCGTCKIGQPEGNFARNSSKPDGLQGVCRQCKKVYNKHHYLATRHRFNPARTERRVRVVAENRERLAEYLQSHPCVDCGEGDIIVLEFDHLRDKSWNIADMVSAGRNWDMILEEINKCDVVCSNDHRRRTSVTFGWSKLNY